MASHRDRDRHQPDQHSTEHQSQQNDADLERDILSGRQFSLADVIGREGGSFLKGDSPVPRLMQVVTEINMFIELSLPDSAGALQAVLKNWVKSSTRVSQHLDQPLVALEGMIQAILTEPQMLYEFVRQVDMKWGEMYDERPHFQRPGQPPHPDDEYTHESVRQALLDCLQVIHTQQSS